MNTNFINNIGLWLVIFIIIYISPINVKYKYFFCLLCLILIRKTLYICIKITFMLYQIFIRNNMNSYNDFTNSIFNQSLYLKHNFQDLPISNTIFVVNYPYSILEYSVMNLIPRNICLIAALNAEKFISIVLPKKNYIVFDNSKKNNFKNIKKKIQKIIKKFSIFVYVEKVSTRIHDEHTGRIRSGFFRIAKDLNITVTPIAIDSILFENGIIPKQKFEIIVGKTHHVDSIKKEVIDIKKFFINSKKYFINSKIFLQV